MLNFLPYFRAKKKMGARYRQSEAAGSGLTCKEKPRSTQIKLDYAEVDEGTLQFGLKMARTTELNSLATATFMRQK